MNHDTTIKETTNRLFYEWWMLCMAEEKLSNQTLDRATQNAWIEAGAIHARNLADFFYPDVFGVRTRPDDALAEDHILGTEWRVTRPDAPAELDRHEFRDPVNKQIAHLTKAGNPKKEWNFSIVAGALQPALEHFLTTVPLRDLGDRWWTLLPDKSGPRWDGARRILEERSEESRSSLD